MLILATALPAPAPVAAQETPQEMVQRVIQLTNQQRAVAGLAPLQVNPNAMQAAQWFAQEMADGDYVSQNHLDRLGRDPAQRAEAFGYSGWYTIGENVAAMIPTPDQVVRIWMLSEPHQANILNPEFCEIGVGFAESAAGIYRFHWVQTFGCRRAETAPPVEPATDAAVAEPAAELGAEPTAAVPYGPAWPIE